MVKHNFPSRVIPTKNEDPSELRNLRIDKTKPKHYLEIFPIAKKSGKKLHQQKASISHIIRDNQQP